LAISSLGVMQNKAVATNLSHYPVSLLEGLERIMMVVVPA
jgi:hypothetical protein